MFILSKKIDIIISFYLLILLNQCINQQVAYSCLKHYILQYKIVFVDYFADMAASVDAQDLKTLLEAKDTLIRNLETLLQARNNEIQELRSHLDMFQSVFPFSNPVSPTSTLHHPHHVVAAPVHQQQSQNLVAKSLTSLLDGIARPRKQRAQGISAEPQSLSTIQELSQKKFPTYPKNDR